MSFEDLPAAPAALERSGFSPSPSHNNLDIVFDDDVPIVHLAHPSEGATALLLRSGAAGGNLHPPHHDTPIKREDSPPHANADDDLSPARRTSLLNRTASSRSTSSSKGSTPSPAPTAAAAAQQQQQQHPARRDEGNEDDELSLAQNLVPVVQPATAEGIVPNGHPLPFGEGMIRTLADDHASTPSLPPPQQQRQQSDSTEPHSVASTAGVIHSSSSPHSPTPNHAPSTQPPLPSPMPTPRLGGLTAALSRSSGAVGAGGGGGCGAGVVNNGSNNGQTNSRSTAVSLSALTASTATASNKDGPTPIGALRCNSTMNSSPLPPLSPPPASAATTYPQPLTVGLGTMVAGGSARGASPPPPSHGGVGGGDADNGAHELDQLASHEPSVGGGSSSSSALLSAGERGKTIEERVKEAESRAEGFLVVDSGHSGGKPSSSSAADSVTMLADADANHGNLVESAAAQIKGGLSALTTGLGTIANKARSSISPSPSSASASATVGADHTPLQRRPSLALLHSGGAASSSAVATTAGAGVSPSPQRQWLQHNDKYFDSGSRYNFYTATASNSAVAAAVIAGVQPAGGSGTVDFAASLNGHGGCVPPLPVKSTGETLANNNATAPTTTPAVPADQGSMIVRVVKKSEAKLAEQQFKQQEKQFERERAFVASVAAAAASATQIVNTDSDSDDNERGSKPTADGEGGGGGSKKTVMDAVTKAISAPKQAIKKTVENVKETVETVTGVAEAKTAAAGAGVDATTASGKRAPSRGGSQMPLEMPTTLLPPPADPIWSHARKLSIAYFFAAWGARMWEFASIVFILDALFPSSLMASSVFGLLEAFAGMCGSGPGGSMIDRKNRLYVVRVGVYVQNISVTIAMALLALAATLGGAEKVPFATRVGILVLVIVLGMTAKFGTLLLRIAIVKDWLVVIAKDNRRLQSELNAKLRRVDTLCQIFAPLFVGLCSLVVGVASTCIVIAGWSLVSTLIELQLNTSVYNAVSDLAVPRYSKLSNVIHYFGDSPAIPTVSNSNNSGNNGGDARNQPVPQIIVTSATLKAGQININDCSRSQVDAKMNNAVAPPSAGPAELVSIDDERNNLPSASVQREAAADAVASAGEAKEMHVFTKQQSSVTASATASTSGVVGVSFGRAQSINDSISIRFDPNMDDDNARDAGCGSLVRRFNGSMRRTLQAWHVYRAHPCFWVSIPYALLSISVLSFGGIMVAFLKTQGCSDTVLSVGRGLASVTSLIPTFIVPYFIPRKGLYRTGSYMLWALVACLAPIAIAMLMGLQRAGAASGVENKIVNNLDQLTQSDVLKDAPDTMPLLFIIIIFFSIITSRFGLWGFDLAQTQMMQELVDKAEVGKVNGSQELVVNACRILSFVLTIIFHNPNYFMWPGIISFTSVLVAALAYTFVGMRTAAIRREAAGIRAQYV